MNETDFASILEEKMRQIPNTDETLNSQSSYFESLLTTDFVNIQSCKPPLKASILGAKAYKTATRRTKSSQKVEANINEQSQSPETPDLSSETIIVQPKTQAVKKVLLENLNLEQQIALEQMIVMGAHEIDKDNLNFRDLKKSYRRLALLHHPDTGSQGESFINLVAFYEILTPAFN